MNIALNYYAAAYEGLKNIIRKGYHNLNYFKELWEMKALVIVNNDIRALKLAGRLYSSLAEWDIDAKIIENTDLISFDCFAADVVFVLGSDETMFKTARYYANYQTPILGVNYGTAGFLNRIEPDDLIAALDQIVNRQYSVVKCFMMDINLVRGGQVLATHTILNNTVIRTSDHHPINIDLQVDSQPYTMINGDGVICFTPAGSTTYSLSSGGPIIDSKLSVIGVTPICPQMFCSHSLILSPESQLTFVMRSDGNSSVSFDGEKEIRLRKGDEITVLKSDLTAKFIRIIPDSVQQKIITRDSEVKKIHEEYIKKELPYCV